MPNQELFPGWAFCIFRAISHYKSLELWGHRWICGVIVRLMVLSFDLWVIVRIVGNRWILAILLLFDRDGAKTPRPAGYIYGEQKLTEVSSMNNIIIAYGLLEEQRTLLESALSEEYDISTLDCITDLIVTDAVCTVINAEKLSEAGMRTLLAYYMDVGDRLVETVVWMGDVVLPNLPSFVRCDNFLDMLTELESILTRAQVRYDTMQMYGSEYAYLPKHAIEESIEADIHTALHRKYGTNPDPLIVKRMRQELTALREVDATAELAAVYEFSAWLKHNKHPYWLGGTAVSGLIPYLQGIHDVNPLPPHLYCPVCQKDIWQDGYKDGFDTPAGVCPECGGLMQGDGHNLVWQEYASYGRVPTYVFYLPYDMQPLIMDWLDSHWLRKYMGDQWEAAQPYEDHLVRGNMHFWFELDRDEISPDFYNVNIDANSKADLIQMVTNDKYYHRNPYPKDIGELLTQLGFRKTVWKEDEVARNILLQNKISWKNIPSCREEVFFYLKEHDFIDKDAFRGMTSVRKGKDLPVVTEDMRAAEDYWKAEYFNQIDWMPSKAMLLQKLFFELNSKTKEEII